MEKSKIEKLLRDRRALQEIERYQWFESEKIGYDIDFEQAARDWLSQFSRDWIKHYRAPRIDWRIRKERKVRP